jgi:hypothetical protein
MPYAVSNLPNISARIGRVRVTRATQPSEAGYIRSMRLQTEQLENVMRQVVQKIEGVTAHAIVYALQPIYDASQELVPVKTGKLKRSGYIGLDTEKRSGAVRAEIGYAKHGNPHYAAFVHEMLHIPHKKGKSAKYLERAVNENIGLFKSRLVARMAELAELNKNG